MTTYNSIQKRLTGRPTSDGAGVKLTRLIGGAPLQDLDPFLLLDHFGSHESSDYIAGFPEHPHRGFETVTYMLKGKMRHKDSAGNEGVISDGDIQWMTAGSGIIHSEMPEQSEGEMSGFQLWVNLPKSHKMTAPNYQEFKAAEIPVEQRDNGVQIKVIAGQTVQGTTGVINNDYVNPNYWDVKMPTGNTLTDHLPVDHNAFIYVYNGMIEIDGEHLKAGELAVLTPAETLLVNSLEEAHFLVISGQPLNEPVARYGPFVMNTMDEINQALQDFRDNKLV
ncbi:MAG: pirin family protein [Proteobacteria bacterium]|nr:MAG: pirin family protein [Pseudomonadota bacterium]